MMDLALIAYMGDGGVFQSATGTDDLLSLVVSYVALRRVARPIALTALPLPPSLGVPRYAPTSSFHIILSTVCSLPALVSHTTPPPHDIL